MTTITDDTPATLAQHKVQAGDVVQNSRNGITAEIIVVAGSLQLAWEGCDDDTFPVAYAGAKYTVLSRATPAPMPHGHVRLGDGRVFDLTANELPLGLLEGRDPEVAEALKKHGGPYQLYAVIGPGAMWADWAGPSAWGKVCTYRVAPLPPAPKVETIAVNRWMTCDALVVGGAAAPEGSVPVRFTFNRIDGKPDPASFKLEAR